MSDDGRVEEKVDKIASDVSFMRGQQSELYPQVREFMVDVKHRLEDHDAKMDELSKRQDAHELMHARAESFTKGIMKTTTLAISGIAATLAITGKYIIEAGVQIFTNAK